MPEITPEETERMVQSSLESAAWGRKIIEACDVAWQKQFANPNLPGRNDPCSCGSGKKFKKCCGA